MTAFSHEYWIELSDWFDRLSDLPPAQQASRLVELERERPDLAARLSAMLTADRVQASVLELSVSDLLPHLQDNLASESWETRPGQVVGRYRLLEPIGSGGMGEVWRAERADGEFRQVVALKLLKRGIDTQAVLRRFRQERSILARLDHPNIVHVLDGGMSEDGRPYYVMPCVDGMPLTEFAAARTLDVRARIALVATLADAVSYAHAQLIVHRDIKPGNAIVDTAGTPHLLDFGIAKLLEDTGDQSLTGTGTRLLSPAYAAPEQILGQPVGTAADVYALGVLLYELVTGALPHRRHSRDPAVLAAGLAQETGDRASLALAGVQDLARLYGPAADRRRLVREVAGDLELILARALKPEPDRRYATAAAFADDLRRYLAGRAVQARPDSRRYRLRRFVMRNRLAVAATAIVLLSLLGGLGGALWQARIARQAADQAQRAESFALQQAGLAAAVSEFLIRDVIQSANPYGGVLDIGLAEALIRAGDDIDARFEGKPRLAGVIHRELASALLLAGQSAPAAKHAERAHAVLVAAVPDDDPDLQQARLTLGQVLHAGDDHARARALYEAGLAALAPGAPERDRLPLQIALAGLDVEARRETEALATIATIEPAVRREFGAFSTQHLDALDHQLRALNQIDRFDEAMTVAQALRLGAEQRFGVGHAQTLKWLQREAEVLLSLKRFPEALALISQACKAQVAALGADHPRTFICKMRRGTVLFELGRFDEAAAEIEPVVAFNEQTRGPDSVQTWLSWIWLGRTLQHRGRLDEARALLERAQDEAIRVHGEGDALALPYRQVLGMFLHQTGALADALALREEVLAQSRRALPEGHVNTAKYAWDLAETLAAMQRDAGYIAFATEWLPHWQRLLGDADNRVVEARGWLAAARRRQGEQ
jgi:serine/threonine-protein kinase